MIYNFELRYKEGGFLDHSDDILNVLTITEKEMMELYKLKNAEYISISIRNDFVNIENTSIEELFENENSSLSDVVVYPSGEVLSNHIEWIVSNDIKYFNITY